MSSGELQFISVHWLWLLPLYWAYLIWWFQKHQLGHHSSIADVNTSAHNHFYHPLAATFLSHKTTESELTPSLWKIPAFWLFGLSISLLIISLAQPIRVGERLPDLAPERDIVFLVDTSVSMQLKDYELQGEPIRRMDLLHNLLDEFASKMAGERIAVIVFAETPYILLPLSNDQGLIRRMLNRVTTSLAGRYSAVGDALLMALFMTEEAANKNAAHNVDLRSDRHQTFILFTDVHESLGNVTTAAAADLLAEKNIPVFTIAIGSSQNSKAEVEGGLYQAVNLALLDDIAKRTQGSSYQVNDSEAMQQALQDILKQRQNTAIPQPRYEQQNLYYYPLIISLLLLVLQQFRRLWVSRK